jgi:hypothetical protein
MTLEEKIEGWLGSQGYALEMRVAKILRHAGFNVQQADYYHDEESSSYREVDVIAKIYENTDNVNYCINFIIECKVSKTYPWVIFKNKLKTDGHHKLMYFPGNELGEEMAALYTFEKKAMSLPILTKHTSLGYTIVETLRSGEKKDNSYASLMSLSKALDSYAHHPKYTHSAGRKICEIFVPLIVILGDLFEGYLDENNEVALSKVDHSAVYWSNPACGNRATLVTIIRVEALEKICQDLKKSSNKLLKLVISEGKIETMALKQEKIKTKRNSITKAKE